MPDLYASDNKIELSPRLYEYLRRYKYNLDTKEHLDAKFGITEEDVNIMLNYLRYKEQCKKIQMQGLNDNQKFPSFNLRNDPEVQKFYNPQVPKNYQYEKKQSYTDNKNIPLKNNVNNNVIIEGLLHINAYDSDYINNNEKQIIRNTIELNNNKIPNYIEPWDRGGIIERNISKKRI